MKTAMRIMGLLATVMLANLAGAAPSAVIENVQSPAWVDRDGKRLPAFPGLELHNRDVIATGSAARVSVQLADGSLVKLGENTQMGVNALAHQEGGLFSAALDVAKGAFRLTTSALRKLQSPRAINVRVGTVTAGIRGTDIWGRSDASLDFICLLEGRIFVTHPESEGVELSTPLQYFGARRGEAPDPVAQVEPEKIETWAVTTEPAAGAARLVSGGNWVVRADTLATPAEALDLFDRLNEAGYPSRIAPVKSDGGYRYEVLVGTLPDEANARLLATRLAAEFTLTSARALKRQAAFRNR